MRAKHSTFCLLAFAFTLVGGCATLPLERPKAEKSDEPKTLLTWSANGKDKNGKDEKNGNGKKNGAAKVEAPEEPERDTIATDRPDFTESSSTVGKGRVQLEAGYTFLRDNSGGTRTTIQTYPETLLRIGLFKEWFEFRIGQTFGSEQTIAPKTSIHGSSDLYLGAKFFLAEQEKTFPETSLIIQTTVPAGARSFSAGQMLPGFNLLYGWDIIDDKLNAGASTQLNRRVDDGGHFYAEFAQSFTMGFKWTPKLGQYTEWFCLVPTGATSSSARTEHYVDGGFTYLITDNFQIDIRAGVGINRAAADFFTGSGFAVRY